MRLRLSICLSACVLVSSGYLLSAADSPDDSPINLPFSTEETSGELALTIRHKIHWNRGSNTVSWERLEAELPEGRTSVSLLPGAYELEKEEAQQIGIRITVRGGSVEADPEFQREDHWSSPIRFDLAEPRDFEWNNPEVRVIGITVDGDLTVDSRLTEGPLRMLAKLELRRLEIAAVESGIYRVGRIVMEGSWLRPNWTLDRLGGDLYGGRIEITGDGEWGTIDHPLVSLEVRFEGVDATRLLQDFNIPRAGEVRGKLMGSVKLRSDGRHWEVLDFDLRGEEGSVYLDRELIYDIPGLIVEGGLTQEDVDLVLDGSFGDAEAIPFEEVGLAGGLTEETLRLRVPLKTVGGNLDIDFQPRIERAILWDIWDAALGAGLENVRGLELAR